MVLNDDGNGLSIAVAPTLRVICEGLALRVDELIVNAVFKRRVELVRCGGFKDMANCNGDYSSAVVIDAAAFGG
jgi:hypothetical protein